jgi:serine protease inhibitor ecotin
MSRNRIDSDGYVGVEAKEFSARAPSRLLWVIVYILAAASGGAAINAPRWLVEDQQHVAAQAPEITCIQTSEERAMQRQISRIERQLDANTMKLDLLIQRVLAK